MASLRIHLFHDAIDMVFDGEFREVQVRGNFFVAHAHGDQRHQLALALSQLKALDMDRMSPTQAWEAMKALKGMLQEKKSGG